MIDLYEYCKDKVLENVMGPKTIRANKIIFRCPFCGDSASRKNRRRGYLYKNVSTNYPSFHCFRCKMTLSTYKFLAGLEGKTIGEVKKEIAKEYMYLGKKSLISFLSKKPQEGEVPSLSGEIEELPTEQDTPKIQLKNTWVDLSNNKLGYDYIKNRKIFEAPYKPENWTPYYDTKTKRIVIPWIRNYEIKYWQARSLNKKDDAKYLFPKDTQKDLFGLDNLDPSFPYIFFLEGVFDAIFVKNGVAIGGLELTKHQLELLDSYKDFYQFIYLPDNPWNDKAAKDNISKMLKNDLSIRFFEWDRGNKAKDINEDVLLSKNLDKYNREYLEKRIISGPQLKAKLIFNR